VDSCKKGDLPLMQKLTELITQLTKGHWRVVPAQTVDALQAEKERLEKNLTLLPPRHTSSGKVKLAELQKFMDLAG
jgi:hypothetical protein